MAPLPKILQPTPEMLALQRAALQRIAECGYDVDTVADLQWIDEERYVGDSRRADWSVGPVFARASVLRFTYFDRDLHRRARAEVPSAGMRVQLDTPARHSVPGDA